LHKDSVHFLSFSGQEAQAALQLCRWEAVLKKRTSLCASQTKLSPTSRQTAISWKRNIP